MIDQRVLTSNWRLLRGSISHLIYRHLNEMHLLSGRKQSVGEELPIVLEQTDSSRGIGPKSIDFVICLDGLVSNAPHMVPNGTKIQTARA